jgi:hypothetical protein
MECTSAGVSARDVVAVVIRYLVAIAQEVTGLWGWAKVTTNWLLGTWAVYLVQMMRA